MLHSDESSSSQKRVVHARPFLHEDLATSGAACLSVNNVHGDRQMGAGTNAPPPTTRIEPADSMIRRAQRGHKACFADGKDSCKLVHKAASGSDIHKDLNIALCGCVMCGKGRSTHWNCGSGSYVLVAAQLVAVQLHVRGILCPCILSLLLLLPPLHAG